MHPGIRCFVRCKTNRQTLLKETRKEKRDLSSWKHVITCTFIYSHMQISRTDESSVHRKDEEDAVWTNVLCILNTLIIEREKTLHNDTNRSMAWFIFQINSNNKPQADEFVDKSNKTVYLFDLTVNRSFISLKKQSEWFICECHSCSLDNMSKMNKRLMDHFEISSSLFLFFLSLVHSMCNNWPLSTVITCKGKKRAHTHTHRQITRHDNWSRLLDICFNIF